MRRNTNSAVDALVVLGATASYSSDALNTLTPAWARAIAQDGYLFGWPSVEATTDQGDQSSPAGDPS